MFSRNRGSKSFKDESISYGAPRPTALRLLTILIYLIALAFLILVEIGNVNNKSVIRNTYFLKIDLANIIPSSVPNAIFINSVAQSIGLHDFYQVGLWGFCEGYNNDGITFCSQPRALYWFNPVEILLNELLAGATIALPTNVTDALRIVRIASRWMFTFFLIGICLTFLCIFFAPMGFSKRPRWSHRARRIFCRQLPIAVLTFLALLFTAAGSVVATVMFVIFRNTFQGAEELNIQASLGIPMLAFMWIATGLDLLGFLFQIGTCCAVCCCSGKRSAERRSRDTRLSMREKSSEHAGPQPGSFGFSRQN